MNFSVIKNGVQKENYDLLVNTSNADIKKVARTIYDYLQDIFK